MSVPAFAVSVLVLNISIPLALAETGIAPGADADADGAFLVVGLAADPAVTVRVPFMPAAACPGTVHKNV